MNKTCRIHFGQFSNGAWIASDKPVIYRAENKDGKIQLRCDAHLTLTDGRVVTSAAYGQSAIAMKSLTVEDYAGGKKLVESGDIVTVNISDLRQGGSRQEVNPETGEVTTRQFYRAGYFNPIED